MSHPSSDHPLSVGIIGGGPAGMSSALWLKQLGLSPHIIERNATLGGQLLKLDRINRWVLGLPGRTSAELAALYAKHVGEEQIPVKCRTEVTAVETADGGYRLVLQEAGQTPTSLFVHALVIATGVTALGRQLFTTIPGFDALHAAGLVGCFPIDHLDKLAGLQGKTVAVIGGGDNAHFTVMDVAPVAARTHLLIRSQPKAQGKVRNAVKTLIKHGAVSEYRETEVGAFRQGADGIGILLTSSGSAPIEIVVDQVFLRVGFTPNTQFLDTLGTLAGIDKQARGYLLTDAQKRTSVPSVYAIGDVASPGLQAVVTAIADGAIAAQAIAQHLSLTE